MKVLLDECLPRPLKHDLPEHEVATVGEMGWAGIKNGALLRLAETAFEVFITADQNLEYQQNLRSTLLAIVVLVAPDNRVATLRPLMPRLPKR
jgi:predicted nuclease of predicted toxin-antitoxin system